MSSLGACFGFSIKGHIYLFCGHLFGATVLSSVEEFYILSLNLILCLLTFYIVDQGKKEIQINKQVFLLKIIILILLAAC